MGTSIANIQTEKRKFRLYEHPWLSLLVFMVTIVFSAALTGMVIFTVLDLPDSSPMVQFAQECSFKILSGFILAPFLLRLPTGKRTYRQFLDDTGLARAQPFFRLVLLGLSCYLILALSQAAASVVYRLTEGLPITGNFIQQVFNLSGALPPASLSLLISVSGALEEVAFRGIVLTVFLNNYPERQSIFYSSLSFGLIHALNLLGGGDFTWVTGQVVLASIIGLFYGYVFVRTRSLLPSMIVHYLGNAFIGSLVGYMQARASIDIQVLYGLMFSFGLVPTTLMILRTKLYTSRWLTSGVLTASIGD